MGVNGIPQVNNPNQPNINPQGARPLNRSAVYPRAFDTFLHSTAQPSVSVSATERFTSVMFHPFRTISLGKKLGSIPSAGEGRLARIKMYLTVRKALSRENRKSLESLLKAGVLNATDTDDGHSTLYHLYAMLKTQRATGLDNKTVLNETVHILNKPYMITQKFTPLSENLAREMLRVRNNPGLNRSGSMAPAQPLTWNDINVSNSATCVSSSVMYYMADKKPGELARHLNELTSPMRAFYEKVKLSELSPDNPEQAYDILKQYNIRYVPVNDSEVMVKVNLPEAGLIRTINSSGSNTNGKTRSGVEAAYQSAITFLSTRSYDPATDYRDSETPGVGSKGLTEMEKTLMETIVKDNGGVGSVTYQVVAGKENPPQGQEGQPFLYGYTRPFEQTAADMVEALNMGEFVIIGITDTDEGGAIVGGHEITLTQAFVDPQDGDLKFVVVDSDDNIPKPVVRSAREIIPRIHHAGLPLSIAQNIYKEQETTQEYFAPDHSDLQNFEPISFVADPLPQQVTEAPAEEVAAAEEAATAEAQSEIAEPDTVQQPATTPQRQVEWLPVYANDPRYIQPQPQPVYYYPPQPVYYPAQQQAYYYPTPAPSYPSYPVTAPQQNTAIQQGRYQY